MDNSESAAVNQPVTSSNVSRGILITLFIEYNGLYLLYLLSVFINFSNTGRFEPLTGYMGYSLRMLLLLVAGLTPFLAIILFFKEHIYRSQEELIKLLFMFEVPTVIISLILSTYTSQTIPFVWIVTIITILYPLLYLYRLIRPSALSNNSVLLMWAYQTVAMAAGYFTLLLSFYLPPMLISTLHSMSFALYGRSYSGTDTMISLLMGLIVVSVVSLFISVPYILTYFLWKLYNSASRNVEKRIGMKKTMLYSLGLFMVILVVVVGSAYRPNIDSYTGLLNKLKNAKTFEEKQAVAKQLVTHPNEIKFVFDDAETAHSRYMFFEDQGAIKSLYKNSFSLDDNSAATIDRVFLTLAYPLTYHGPNLSTLGTSDFYTELFGLPADATYNGDGSGQIRMTNRSVNTVTDYNGLLATVTVEEEFSNPNYRQEQVIYNLSFPADAVVTGLKLGPNLEYNGIIAPHGAAATTYNSEVTLARDPALLEQTGPRQYRLRIFPIPARFGQTDGIQKISYTYVTGARPGGYPLPMETDTSGVVSSEKPVTQVSVNGNASFIDDKKSLITSQAAENALAQICSSPAKINAKVEGGAYVKPLSQLGGCDETRHPDLAKYVHGKRIAIMYDVSYKNKDSKFPETLRQYLLKTNLAANNQIDLFPYNSLTGQAIPLSVKTLEKPLSFAYFGPNEWLRETEQFSGMYDALFVLAPSVDGRYYDGYSRYYSISFNSSIPLYIQHEEARIPEYQSFLSDHIYSFGGQVVDSFQEAINHFALTHVLAESINTNPILAGPYWEASPGSFSPDAVAALNDPVNSLSARAYYLNHIHTLQVPPPSDVLDQYLNVSQKYHFVTPYTSLIALVNQAQLQRLDINSQSTYRYDTSSSPQTRSNPNIWRNTIPISGSSDFGGMLSPVSGPRNTIRVDQHALGFSIPNYTGPLFLLVCFVGINIITILIVLAVASSRKKKTVVNNS